MSDGLDAIRARADYVTRNQGGGFPGSAIELATQDIPRLLAVAEAAQAAVNELGEPTRPLGSLVTKVYYDLRAALAAVEGDAE